MVFDRYFKKGEASQPDKSKRKNKEVPDKPTLQKMRDRNRLPSTAWRKYCGRM